MPNFKIGDPIMPSNYTRTMIGHYLAKLYGVDLRVRIEYMGRENWLLLRGTDRLLEWVHNLDHFYCCFLDF